MELAGCWAPSCLVLASVGLGMCVGRSCRGSLVGYQQLVLLMSRYCKYLQLLFVLQSQKTTRLSVTAGAVNGRGARRASGPKRILLCEFHYNLSCLLGFQRLTRHRWIFEGPCSSCFMLGLRQQLKVSLSWAERPERCLLGRTLCKLCLCCIWADSASMFVLWFVGWLLRKQSSSQ